MQCRHSTDKLPAFQFDLSNGYTPTQLFQDVWIGYLERCPRPHTEQQAFLLSCWLRMRRRWQRRERRRRTYLDERRAAYGIALGDLLDTSSDSDADALEVIHSPLVHPSSTESDSP